MTEETVNWCSLLCTGNEAIGTMTLPFDEETSIDVPICVDCLAEFGIDAKGALARVLYSSVDSEE